MPEKQQPRPEGGTPHVAYRAQIRNIQSGSRLREDPPEDGTGGNFMLLVLDYFSEGVAAGASARELPFGLPSAREQLRAAFWAAYGGFGGARHPCLPIMAGDWKTY